MADDVNENVNENEAEDAEVVDDAQASDDLDADWGAAFDEAGDSAVADDDNKAVAEVSEDDGYDGAPNLDVILDIPVTISMEVGSTEIAIRNLLQLNQGSVIELDRLAGESLDVKVNGTLIAHGEVVMVNEKFGIRLIDVISQSERIQKLRKA